MGEVEAEALGGDVGALLVHVVAQDNLEGLVEQVRGGVQTGGLLGVVGQTALEDALALLGGLFVLGLGLGEAVGVDGHAALGPASAHAGP